MRLQCLVDNSVEPSSAFWGEHGLSFLIDADDGRRLLFDTGASGPVLLHDLECAACHYQCPEDAIRMEPRRSGLWFRSETRFGPLLHARVFAGQENSGKLVTLVKQQARDLARSTGRELVLVDGPPGIGCPVIAAVSGADLALMVAEPSVSGIHDLRRALATARRFRVPSLVVINKADLNSQAAGTLEEMCEAQGVEVVGRVPYNPIVTEAMVRGEPVTVHAEGTMGKILREVWKKTRTRLLEAEVVPV